jgi:hypothetical protein
MCVRYIGNIYHPQDIPKISHHVPAKTSQSKNTSDSKYFRYRILNLNYQIASCKGVIYVNTA